jgi:hypothetical protein
MREPDRDRGKFGMRPPDLITGPIGSGEQPPGGTPPMDLREVAQVLLRAPIARRTGLEVAHCLIGFPLGVVGFA